MKIRLQVTASAGAPFALEHQGPSLRVGRDPEAELTLQGEASQSVSWHHARIELKPQAATLTDLKSTNGTLLNDKRIDGPVPLRLGDRIQLGFTGPTLKVVELDLAVPAVPLRAATRKEAPAARPVEVPLKPEPRSGRLPATSEILMAMQRGQRNMLLAVGALAAVVLLVVLVALLRSGKTGTGTSRDDQQPPPKQPDPIAVNGPIAGQNGLVNAATNTSLNNGRVPADAGKAAPNPSKQKPAEDTPAADASLGAHQEVGRYVAPAKAPPSVLLQRHGDTEPWGKLRADMPVSTGYNLLSLPGYRSSLVLKSGVELVLWGNVPEFSSFPPVFESAAMLQTPAPGFDVEFMLDRGRVHLMNLKPTGAVHARVHFLQEVWDLTLPDKASEAVVELWGFYPNEVPFSKDAGGKGPLQVVGVFVKGQAQVKAHGQQYDMPNQSQLVWTSARPTPTGPEILPQLPGWWTNTLNPKESQVADMMIALIDYSKLLEKSDTVVDAVLTQVRESPVEQMRVLGVLVLSALDAVPYLVDFLEDRQHPEVRGTAALALRHWTSRSRDYDLELYRILQERKGYSKEKAEIIMRLLHNFSPSDLDKPATYEMLIGYLDHENLVIRELAFWHLSNLAPNAVKDLPPDWAVDPDKRKQVVELWKKAIPAGTVLPRPATRAGT
jgi:pSer/pThr/pTyr-binding forkhead associated (FHA) protein